MIRTRSPVRDLITSPRSRVGGNLLRNGNFELSPAVNVATTTARRWLDGTAAGSTTNAVYGWGTGGNANTNATVQIDPTTILNGRPTLRISLLTVNNIANAFSVAGYDNFAAIKRYAYQVTPDFFNSTYVLTYKMKTNVTSGSATTGARVGIYQWSGSGGLAGSNYSTGTNTTTDWTEYSYPLTLNNGSTRFLEVVCEVKGNDGAATLLMDAWFTDIRLTRREPVTRGWA